MEISKANLQAFNNRLEFHWVSLVPTVFRRVFLSICVGFFLLEKSPGGFCFQVPFRVRFPKPPWNFFYTKILPVIDYCEPVLITAYGDMNRSPVTTPHLLPFTGFEHGMCLWVGHDVWRLQAPHCAKTERKGVKIRMKVMSRMIPTSFSTVGTVMASRKLMEGDELGPFGVLIPVSANAISLSLTGYISWKISGGHVIPAVTFAKAFAGRFSVPTAMLYWNSQMVASVLNCLISTVTVVEQHVPIYKITGEMTGFGVCVLFMEFLQVCLVFRFNFGCNTIRMTGSTSGVLVKEANTTWRLVIDQKTTSMFTMDLMAETYGFWYYIISVEVKKEDDTSQFERHKLNDPNKQRSVSPLPQMPLPDVFKETRSERKRFLTPRLRRMDSEKGMKSQLSHKNSFEKRSINLRSFSGHIRDLGTLGFQERVKSKKDTGWSMRRWPDVKSSNWPFTSLDWVLVYLGTQVLSREVTSVFKTSIWKIRQRRLPDDHSEFMTKSSIILISTKRQDTTLFSTTSVSHFKSKVMPKAFWSLSYKLLANNKYVKEGHNRLFHLLAWQTSERIAWLLSTLSSKLFQFPIFAYNGCIVLVLYFVNSS